MNHAEGELLLDAGPVVLRTYTGAETEELVSLLRDPIVMRHALYERPLSPVEAEQFVADQFAAGAWPGYATVWLKETGRVVGFSGFRDCRYLGDSDVEFFWVISLESQGRGYATALGLELIRYGLESLRKPRVLAACNPRNVVSEHVLRDKLRMRFARDVELSPVFHRRVYVAESVAVRP